MKSELIEYWEKVFTGTYRSDDSFFIKLWRDRRLKTQDNTMPDIIDEFNSKLVCATLHKKNKILILLPDNQTWRSAFLFASGLIMLGLDSLKHKKPAGQVLYFGSNIAIRRQMENILIGWTPLNKLFVQIDKRVGSTQEVSYLPQILGIYSPADPMSIFETNKNIAWVVIDCRDFGSLKWLPPLLEKLKEKEIPIVAWANSPFSHVEVFRRNDVSVYQWPTKSLTNAIGKECVTTIEVFTIQGNDPITTVINRMKASSILLARASKETSGRLSEDAVQLGRYLLSQFELLSVPLHFFESEAKNYWGLKTISETIKAFRKFIDTLYRSRSVHSLLEDIYIHFEDLYQILSEIDPPLWRIATNLCVESVSQDTARIVVFPNKARRELFAQSLLVKYNISEFDLKQLNIYVSDPKTIQNNKALEQDDISVIKNNYGKIEIILVGLINYNSLLFIESIEQNYNLKTFIYPYQTYLLEKNIEKFNEFLVPNEVMNLRVITELGGRREIDKAFIYPSYLRKEGERTYEVVYTEKRHKEVYIWRPVSTQQELEIIFDSNMFEDEYSFIDPDTDVFHEIDENNNVDSNTQQCIYVDEAVYIKFSGGYSGFFIASEKLNVIVNKLDGPKVEERLINSIKPGDRILFIEGQKRQSLYNLVISRVHQHPSIELHLALIRKWQEDVKSAWKKHKGINVTYVLEEMRKRGSKLESPSAITQWIRGDILNPMDPKDLYRIADILNMEFVKKYYKNINRAANRLRGLHRGISRRLNRWLKEQASGVSSGKDDEIFDKDLGLSLNDFKDSILILTVLSKDIVSGPFLRNKLGALKMEGEKNAHK